MSERKGKLPALLYDVPGAGSGWHQVAWIPGIFHPEIPVPHDQAESYVEAQRKRIAEDRKKWDVFEKDMEEKGFRQNGRLPFIDPGIPVKLVYISEKQAEEGLKAAEAALESVPPDTTEEE